MKEITSLQIGENKIRLNRVIDYTSVKNSNPIVDTSSINGYYSNSYTCPDDGVVILFGSEIKSPNDISYYIKDKNTNTMLEQKHFSGPPSFGTKNRALVSGQIQVHKGQVIEYGGTWIGNGFLKFYPYK